jgi:hypothetical protein
MSTESSFRQHLVTGLKILLLTAVMFFLFSTIYTVTGVATDPSLATGATASAKAEIAERVDETVEPSGSSATTPAQPARTAMILVGVCFLQTVALSVAILRSRWTGWKLILAMFTVMVLGSAILSHIDSLFFLREMSRALIAKLALASTLLAAAFSTIAVWVLGRSRNGKSEQQLSELEHHSTSQWVLIVLGLAVLHIVLYFVFGYYVAWKSPELRAFYGGEDPGSFWLQMVSVVKGTPWLIPIQVLRGALWGLMAIILASSLAGSRWSAALISASIMVMVFASPLALPNPLMPDAVRQAHLIETALSRGLYGFLAVWLLRTPLHSRHAHPKPA